MSLSDKEKKKYKRRTEKIKELKEWESYTYKWWRDRLEEFPDAVSADLKEQVKYLNKRIKELDIEHTKLSEDHYSNRQYTSELQEMIDVYTSLKDKFDELLEKHGKAVLQKKKRGRKLKNPEIKSRVLAYFNENREQLEKENRDEKGHIIHKHVSVQIINELDEELNIKSEYGDAPRTITGWIYE